MSNYCKNVNVLVGRCEAELEVYFDVTPGQRASWDEPGWAAELDGYTFDLNELRFDSGSVISYDWLRSRGLLDFAMAVLNERVDSDEVEASLGNLEDYIGEYAGD